jgi:5-methylcytosine-specific restriction enzyme subunit McrC
MRRPAVKSRVSITLSEWSAASPYSHPALRNLSFGDDDHTRLLCIELSRQGVVDVTELRHGMAVETKSFVGRVSLGPLELSIVPKLSAAHWSGMFSFALRLRNVVRTKDVVARLASTSLHDIVILELLGEARNLIGRGLHREYVDQRKALATPKGRIDFNRIAKSGGLRAAAIPSRFTRRSDDSLLNRALLAGLAAAVPMATDSDLRSDVRRVTKHLREAVTLWPLTGALVDSARNEIDRRTARYAPAFDLIDLLRQGRIVSTAEPGVEPGLTIHGFALDMNMLWQRTLGRVLAEWTNGFDIRQEVSLAGLITADPEYAPRKTGPRMPRPDFAVFKGQTFNGYLDAKYRDIWDRGLPRDMLYQLALYATAQGQGAAAVLYPTDSREAREERLRIHNPADQSVRGVVALRPVHMGRLAALIGAAPSSKRTAERAAFGRELLDVA